MDLKNHQKSSAKHSQLPPKGLQTANLEFEDEVQFYIVLDLSVITSLHITFTNIDNDMNKLVRHLEQCVNVEQFTFTPFLKLTRDQYSQVYWVINNKFGRLRYLKTLHTLEREDVESNTSDVYIW